MQVTFWHMSTNSYYIVKNTVSTVFFGDIKFSRLKNNKQTSQFQTIM